MKHDQLRDLINQIRDVAQKFAGTAQLRERIAYLLVPVIQDLQPGLVDPDYARIFTIARVVGWSHGYAAVAHGSFNRDLDLLFVPWSEKARADHSVVLKHFASAAKLDLVQGLAPAIKPHGRIAYTLLLPEFGDPRFIDVSFMPTNSQPSQ